MHRAMFRNLASVCREGLVDEPGPGGPPPGMSFWHFACAALNRDDERSIPALAWKRKPPSAFGSGKLGTPLERMHLAKAIAACWGLAVLSADEAPRAELAEDAPFPVERCATPGLDEPPQPASASATLASTTTPRLTHFMRCSAPSAAAQRHHVRRKLRIG